MRAFHDVKLDQIRVFHYLKVSNLVSGITVATGIVDGKLFTSLAVCSVSDKFNKKIGAAIAVGRLKKIVWEVAGRPT